MSGRTRIALGLLLLGLVAVVLVSIRSLRTPEETVHLQQFRGRVVDSSRPVRGVRVRLQGEPNCVLTDQDGHFSLPRSQKLRKITAFKASYLIGSAEPVGDLPVEIELSPVPTQDCERYRWVDPSPSPSRPHNCANCHAAIYEEWSISGHAHAATDPHFINIYNGTDWHGHSNVGWNLQADRPEAAGVCTTCHAPTVDDFNDPAYLDLAQVKGVNARGVHCDYCHKIAGVTNRKIGLTHGRFGFELRRPSTGQLFFGPLDDVDRHEDTALPIYGQSLYCASCHEGTVLGIHVYSTYYEWQHSSAAREGKQCQTCHMAPTGRMTNIAPGKGGIERHPQTLANHRFFAGDQRSMLQRCLKVNAVLAPMPNALQATVTIRADDVGHRVPTGFVDHNLVFLVEATDSAGRPLARVSGPELPALAGKQVSGQAGRLYAKVLHGDGHGPVPFWLADPTAEDTRLRPGQADTSRFVFPIDTARLRVRVLYRRFWPQVAESKGWPDNEMTIVDQTWQAPGW